MPNVSRPKTMSASGSSALRSCELTQQQRTKWAVCSALGLPAELQASPLISVIHISQAPFYSSKRKVCMYCRVNCILNPVRNGPRGRGPFGGQRPPSFPPSSPGPGDPQSLGGLGPRPCVLARGDPSLLWLLRSWATHCSQTAQSDKSCHFVLFTVQKHCKHFMKCLQCFANWSAPYPSHEKIDNNQG